MIKIEKQKTNSLNPNIELFINASTLYNICKEGIKGFPTIDYNFDKSFANVLGFNIEVDQLVIDIYMSELITKIIDYYNTNDSMSILNSSIPEVVVYQLSVLYGLTPFESLFTTIEKDSIFVFKDLWKDGFTNEATINDIKNCYGEVDLCYNTNTVPKFITYYKGDLDTIPNDILSNKISITPTSRDMKEGSGMRHFTGTLTIPSSYIINHSSFETKTMWKNTIGTKELSDTNNFQSNQSSTTDGLQVNTLSISNTDNYSTQTYDMYKEIQLKKLIDNYFNSYGLELTSYGNYPYNKYIYKKPGDSKIIKQNKKTLLYEPSGIFLKNGSDININEGSGCGGWTKSDDWQRDGHHGTKFLQVQINGWQYNDDKNHSSEIDDNDIETLQNNDIIIKYSYQKNSERYRIGNLFGKDSEIVYENDRECYVKDWDGTNNSSSNDNIFLQNQYSYGDKVKLENNPRTCCTFKIDKKLQIYTNTTKNLIQKLGRVCLYMFINDCLTMIKNQQKEFNLAYQLNNYMVQCNKKGLSGLYEESPFIDFILFTQEKVTKITYEDMIKRFGDRYKLQVSQEDLYNTKSNLNNTDLSNNGNVSELYEIYLPKLEINGSTIRFTTMSYSDYNRYYIYGNPDYWSIRSIPIVVDDDHTIDNVFLVHNEIYNKNIPNIFKNFNVFE